jgi:DNA-binding NtrC family response regulator
MKQRRLLIVDDETDIREFIAFKASTIGITSTEARDGQEALEKFKDGEFEAIISDLKMPRMSGIDLLRTIRAQGHQIPFVMLTAFGDKQTVIEALKLGAFDFIEKPSYDEDLFRVLNSAVELGAELNFWKHELGVTEALIEMNTENAAKATAEIERLFALIKSKRTFSEQK